MAAHANSAVQKLYEHSKGEQSTDATADLLIADCINNVREDIRIEIMNQDRTRMRSHCEINLQNGIK